MKSLCFATNNSNKTEEIRALLGPFFVLKNLRDIGCAEDLPETQATIEGNALQKAKYVFDHYHVPCFADDTGLEVESLNGEPGVFSARYARLNGVVGQAGEHRGDHDNIELLLARLASASKQKRPDLKRSSPGLIRAKQEPLRVSYTEQLLKPERGQKGLVTIPYSGLTDRIRPLQKWS
jgi:non-canonical purine NTP pyrophosphatase (RdgB/HAM1 family)